MEKEKKEGRKNKGRLDKIPLDHESKKDESGDGPEEIFGVHVLGDKDNEKHFGVPPKDDSADQKTKNE